MITQKKKKHAVYRTGFLSVFLLICLIQAADAQTNRPDDHPLIQPYTGSVMQTGSVDEFNEYQRIIGFENRQNQTERLEGKLTRLRYSNPPGRSSFEILANYKQALESQGFVADYECTGRDNCGSIANPGWNTINGMNVGATSDVRYMTGKLRYGEGEAYVSVVVTNVLTYLHILERAEMETNMVVADAGALASELEREGRVRVEGIFFDTGLAVVKPESDDALNQVALLLKQNPALRLYVVGHTDSTGDFGQNMTLSKNRADAVVQVLVDRFDINRARLSGHGVGPLTPASTNNTESGRSLNRRVEIVQQ